MSEIAKTIDKGYMYKIEHDEIEQLAFDLYNIFAGNHALMKEMTALEEERAQGEEVIEFGEDYPSIFFDHDRINQLISKKLLYLALLIRTLDDQYRQLYSKQYDEYYENIEDCGTGYGACKGKEIDLRTACSKIIHANQVIPLYEDKWDVHPGFYYLRGIILLEGERWGKKWSVDFYLDPFLTQVSRHLAFVVNNRGSLPLK